MAAVLVAEAKAVRAAAVEVAAAVLQLALVEAAVGLVGLPAVAAEWEGAVVVTAAAALERVPVMQV
jgi:hypothetical protein